MYEAKNGEVKKEMEIGEKIKCFRPGEGTITITITKMMALPRSIQAQDNNKRLFMYEDQYHWERGGELYYTLSPDGKILDLKCDYQDRVEGKNQITIYAKE